MREGLRYYGYNVIINDINDEVDELKKEEIDTFLKNCKTHRYNEVTTQTLLYLDHINDGNIDIYRELLRGNYEIFKDEKYKEVRVENKLYAESLERNTAIVLSLYKYYDCETIKEIYNYCIEPKTNRINFSKLERIRQFANIQSNIKKKRLDFPIYKFINEARKWANDNHVTTKTDIDMFLATWASKYCNSVEDVVIDDTQYLETIYELICELWKVIIVQGRPKKGNITITPFELLWQTKQELNNIYGNINTQTFFLEQLIDEIKDDEEENTEEEVLPELPHTHKLKLEDVENDLINVVHEGYDYNVYSKETGENDRFIRKQENTNQLRDNIFKQIEEENKNNDDKPKSNILEIPF